MLSLIKNDNASIGPPLKFLAIVIIMGTVHAILTLMISAVLVLDSNMDLLMWRAWLFCIIILLIVGISWLFMAAQKPRSAY